MANTLTAYVPKLLAQGLLALREAAIMPRLVNRGLDRIAGEKGSSIDVPIPSAISAGAVSPSYVPPDTTGVSPTVVNVPLDQWYEAAFYLTDKELAEVDAGIMPGQASEAIKALANNVNAAILALGANVYGYAGTAGTTPFASDLSQALEAAKVLNIQLAPTTDRHIVIDPTAQYNAMQLRAIQDASWRANAAGITEATIGRILGYDWHMHQLVPTFTKGAAGTFLLDDSAARAVGVKTLHMDGATTKPAAGDVFTIAGDTQTYVVVSSTTLVGTDTDVTFEPGLKVAIPAADGNEAVTFKATRVRNLAFHRDAFVFATRPLVAPVEVGIMQTIADAESGLSLRLEVTREHKRTRWSYDILYGVKTVRPELACVIAG